MHATRPSYAGWISCPVGPALVGRREAASLSLTTTRRSKDRTLPAFKTATDNQTPVWSTQLVGERNRHTASGGA
ncbi:unnamed protein product [Parajaminaea phylloscopi]